MHFHFLKELRDHLKAYEAADSSVDTSAIDKFLIFVESKYIAPAPAVVADAAPLGNPVPASYIAPVVNEPIAPVHAEDVQATIPVVEETAPAVDTTPVVTPAPAVAEGDAVPTISAA